jgi:NADH-quinone oxidoreductase subunit G
MIAAELADRLGLEDLALELGSLDAITTAIAANVPAYEGVTPAALDAAPDGLLAVPASPGGAAADSLGDEDIPVPERNSYDYRLIVSRKLYDRAVGTAMSPSLAPLAVAATAAVNPLDLGSLGIAEGSDVQLKGARGSVVLPLVGDVGVPRGSVRVPFLGVGASVADIIDAGAAVHDVRIERL